MLIHAYPPFIHIPFVQPTFVFHEGGGETAGMRVPKALSTARQFLDMWLDWNVFTIGIISGENEFDSFSMNAKFIMT